ncbi:MAG: UvrD-helicase domain-containing protein [Rhodanobacter sp.]
MRFTHEQEVIIASKAPVLKVSAFAGTGKTSTLRGYAEANPNERILYVAFNKAIQVEASHKFPKHVTAKTAHSIAYGQFGHRFGAIDKKLQGDIKAFHVLPFLSGSVKTMPAAVVNLYGGRVIDTVKAFLVSGDPDFDVNKHVRLGDSPAERQHFDPKNMVADAHRVWELMQSLESKVPMLHDGYLKLFQLSGRTLPYDIVLLDEAQDTNPVTQAIVDAQPGRKVYVGDKHQAIYGFRGASNAMAQIKADAEFHLTGSFRFGDAVAEVANTLLAVKDEDVKLRGLGGPSQLGVIRPRAPHAYIARGNAALFHRAVHALQNNEPFAFVGELRNYRLDLIEDTHRLVHGDQPQDAFLRSFASFDALQEYAEAIGDKEVAGRCRLVANYGDDIPRLVRLITEKALPPVLPEAAPVEKDHRVILSSAHRSKGMEFDNVKLANDFMDLLDDEGKLLDLSRADSTKIEEINLQYVAATRARKVLEPCDGIQCYLDYVTQLEAQHRAVVPA